MRSIGNSLLAGGCHVFGLALLALSATAGGSAVRAANSSILQNVVFDPIAQIILGIEQRVADLEATIAAFAGSFSSERVIAQQLCIADGSGAQTCIAKAQLDTLLRGAVQVGGTSVTSESGANAQASADKSVLPDFAVTMLPQTPPAIEQLPATADDTGPHPAVAAVISPAIDKTLSAVDESAMAVRPDTRMPSAMPPSAAQPTAAAGQSSIPLAAVATGMPQAIEPAEAVDTAEQSAKNEEPAHSDAVAVKSFAPELNEVPAEVPSDSERQE